MDEESTKALSSLVKSFEDQCKRLPLSSHLWAVLFLCGFVCLNFINFYLFLPLLEEGTLDIIKNVITYLIIQAPFIWFTLFSAIQYKKHVRTKNEYACLIDALQKSVNPQFISKYP